MKHWLTIHYPHIRPVHPWSIYLKERYKRKAKQIEVGDQVFFYELAGKSGSGRRAIVAIGDVRGLARKNTERGDSPEDERDAIWEIEIPCGRHNFSGRVDRATVYDVLGWPKDRPMQLQGGLMKLKPEAVESLRSLFAHP